MEPLQLYFIKSSSLLALFFAVYYVLLRKETFFTGNRWFLLLGLVTSAVFPLFTYTEIIWVDPNPNPIDWSNLPVSSYKPEATTTINWWLMASICYGLGVLYLSGKFVLDIYKLQQMLKGQISETINGFTFVNTTENTAPFSFFKTIVYNSSLYSANELNNIIDHEKVHSAQYHSSDVLLSRIFCIIFWFNPVVWLYKKAMVQNLEFIADQQAIKKIANKKEYQFTLLKFTTHQNCVALTNPFYQSLIKKRIVMLNKNQSKKWNSWKYATVVPALVAFFTLFQIEVVAQEKTSTTTSSSTKSQNPNTLAVSDTVKKGKTSEVISKNLPEITDENTSIFINGKKVTKKELDSTNPNDIATVNIEKNNDKSVIKIFTKENSNTIGNGNIFSSNELSLDRIDPNNLSVVKKENNVTVVKQIRTEKNGIPEDTEVYVNDKRVSALEAESLLPSTITSVNVTKDEQGKRNSIRIITKNYIGEHGSVIERPQPPVPPVAPKFNFTTPKAPIFPAAPKAPSGVRNYKNEKEWADFDKKMKTFDKKMEAMEPQMKAFEKKMEEFEKQMKPFNEEMEEFEKKMKDFEKAMEAFEAKQSKNN
ncbi:M56 family metallopeptidase [Flavobacterium sp. K77]|uniref:M56 family metallopeptidase n=1 Tax=Flavobacterium sp. K77 TaxID=2910676 RepID=UPI001F47FCE5|nr:M56 family metallopeptidase [Flavobacterium sp. K77]MCF6141373.1 M56 family metallopeptidase [Flavobacterium sp. K77]